MTLGYDDKESIPIHQPPPKRVRRNALRPNTIQFGQLQDLQLQLQMERASVDVATTTTSTNTNTTTHTPQLQIHGRPQQHTNLEAEVLMR